MLLFFLISPQKNVDNSLGDASNVYPQYMILWRNKNNTVIFAEKQTLPYLDLWLRSTFYMSSRKHAYIILTPLNSTLYSKTRVYRVYNNFLFLLKTIDCGYLLEPPRRGGSNKYPQSMF